MCRASLCSWLLVEWHGRYVVPLAPWILDWLLGRLTGTEDSGRSRPRMRCSLVSKSGLIDDVDGVQDPNQLGGVNGRTIDL
jgi:hypothetical protein